MEERITKQEMKLGEVKTISGRTQEEEVRILLEETKVKKRAKVSRMAVVEAPWTAVLKDVQGVFGACFKSCVKRC